MARSRGFFGDQCAPGGAPGGNLRCLAPVAGLVSRTALLPVLAVAFILSQRGTLAFYREGIFQARISDLDIDYLAKDPADVQLRWMDLTGVSRRLLSEMADVVREMDEKNELSHLEPIDVARGLVAIHDRLPPWVGRTQRLSRNAKHIRQLFKQAKDPNRLIFDDMPKVLDDATEVGEEEATRQIADQVRAGLMELKQAYPAMLKPYEGNTARGVAGAACLASNAG